MAVAGKQVLELLQDNSYEECSKFGDSEDDFHRSGSNIHPNDEDNWEVCEAGNGTVRSVATQISFCVTICNSLWGTIVICLE